MGSLADVGLTETYQLGFQSFVRLVGTVYFKKYSSGFETQTPATHFTNFVSDELTVLQQHTKWLDDLVPYEV